MWDQYRRSQTALPLGVVRKLREVYERFDCTHQRLAASAVRSDKTMLERVETLRDPITGLPKVLCQGEPLILIARSDRFPVGTVRSVRHPYIAKPTHRLAVFQHEGHVRTHFQHRLTPACAPPSPSEAGVEESCI